MNATWTRQARTDVLLIDDSITDLRLLIDFLSLRALRVSVATQGERGYEQAVALEPGLILLDVRMPDVDGYAVCRLLKANPRTADIPVIFLTAATDREERLTGFALGAVDYINKPFDPEEVLARVGVHLRLAHRRNPELTGTKAGAIAGATTQVTRDAVLVTSAQRVLLDLIHSPPTLDDLARMVGSNRRRLNEAFQALCGQPVYGWFREERLRRAQELLANSDTSVSVIADSLGYSTPANFTKAFRERYGCSPTELRATRLKQG